MTDARLLGKAVPPNLSYQEAGELLGLVRKLLAVLVAAFWTPVALLARASIGRRDRGDFLSFVRPIEQLLRRFILAEAIALAPDLSPAARPKAPRTRRQVRDTSCASNEFSPVDSTTWRAGFSIVFGAPRDPAIRRRAYAAANRAGKAALSLYGLRQLHPTPPLARRLEAVIRVAADPAPFILRLARRLRRKPPRDLGRVFASPLSRWDAVNDHLEALIRHAIPLKPCRDTS